MENLKRDQNHVTVLGAITNDSNQYVKMLKIDPATGRLIVSAVVAGTNNGQLKVSGADSTYGYLSDKLVAGSNVTLTVINPGANEELRIDVQGGGYDEIQENAVALPLRNILNFKNGFTVSDNVGNVSTDVEIDEAELDLANIGGQLDLATQVTGLLNATNIDESSLDLANIGGSLDLSTQVTGLLDVSNIDVTSLANDSTFVDALVANTYFTSELANNATFIGDLITELNLVGDIAVVADGVTITGTGTTLDPLVAVGGGGTGTALETTVSQTAHGLSVGDVIKVSGTNTFAKAQGNTEVNSETVGVVTTVVNANSFKYVSSAIQLAYAPVGTPGSAVWLSPTVAGGMTTTKPSATGQVARALGTIIESGAKMYFDIAALAEVIGSGSGTGVGSFAKRIYAYVPGSASGSYTFAHGLSVVPTYGLTQVYPVGGPTEVGSFGQTDFNSLQSCVYTVFTSSFITSVSTAQSFFYQTGSSVSSYGTLSADATNITATVAGSSSANAYYIILDLYI